jgi:cell division GTPase FtsZ
MKPLTQKDLSVLAKIIRETICYKVYIRRGRIFVKDNKQIIAVVVIRGDKAFSTNQLEEVPMKLCFYTFRKPDWRILI